MSTTDNSTKVLSPTKLAHVVLHTHQYDRMLQFYTRFLGANIVFENGHLAFLSYDEEHHRIAIISIPGMKEKDPQTSGLGHISFAYDSLKDLCASYKQRKMLGMEPGWCVNHGPTTSLYYCDPDGNSIEIQVDNFETNGEATAFMMASFERNPLGVDFDIEELCRKVERGEDEGELKRPKVEIVRNRPEDLVRAARLMQQGTTGL
ncbi:hypothetical protein LTR78_010092 [Recurvomyces mirabilis]|uniref:VOC domain-containing protein n=1 Tax=Recurvomyces mirabilis TaxID=574656 RepID=A0AAE0TQD3_9PEZI|nr:hypothetical protein LTR78_010092 [Recurvomyces mirabilis]KAK5159802.1 hypothetical protein LTS14_001907 [Recurvomyces mirabilis]